jgi:Zn-dependent peptidase ImmA (M78 family)
MISSDAICTLIKEQHITIILAPLPNKIHGFYYLSPDNRSRIALNRDLAEGSPEYRSILAEELGHHFTSIGESSPLTTMSYHDRIQRDRVETKAVRWASDFLIPTEQLLCTIEDCSVSCMQELADAFQVTVELIQHKLYYMSCTTLYWSLSDGRSLCLASLPSIYIYDPFTCGIP